MRLLTLLAVVCLAGCWGTSREAGAPDGATEARGGSGEGQDGAADPGGPAAKGSGSASTASPCGLPPAQGSAPALGVVAKTRRSARVGFESTGALFEFVEGPFPDTSGCEGIHQQALTHAAANRVGSPAGAPFVHMDRLTFASGRDPKEPSPAVGELYLHGDTGEAGYVVLRGLDLRKFLFQDIVLNDCTAAPGSCDLERLPGPDSSWMGAEAAAAGYEGEPFDSDRFSCIRDVHGFFAEFNRITKKIREQRPQPDDRRLLHLTNNCREPGNYELALISDRDGKLWKDHVSLDIGFYSRVLADISVDHESLGTGLRVVGTERKPDGTYAYEDVAPKDFPAGCSIANLAPYVGKAQRLLTPKPQLVALELRSIPYEEFSGETNAKSGKGDDESIVYTEVRAGRPGPTAWRPAGFHFVQRDGGPVERMTGTESWQELVRGLGEGTRIWAPHTFLSFRDAQAHPIAISAFEVDGRYLGRLPARRLATDAARLYSFDYRWLDDLRRFEVREAIEQDGRADADPSRLEFRLLNRACGKPKGECINLVIGNIALAPGEETSLVLGIGTQPLREMYENSVLQGAQQYALTYDEAGHITELVGRYGLGLVVVRRSKEEPSRYTIDLVSYERALPLWRGVVAIEG
ncbi:MAG: hypothetical protein KDA24_16055 [Deltaproteobacteria bacterium]|nr:hypothetical protein [Deltaproteobacteria bacterium]